LGTEKKMPDAMMPDDVAVHRHEVQDPNAASAEKVKGELDELLNSGRVTGFSVAESGDGKKKITVDVEMHRASPGPSEEESEMEQASMPVAARSVSRITKEAMVGLSEVYPKEFLQGMGLDL
jgi:hypothetical protein